jgi:hypothetical protein
MTDSSGMRPLLERRSSGGYYEYTDSGTGRPSCVSAKKSITKRTSLKNTNAKKSSTTKAGYSIDQATHYSRNENNPVFPEHFDPVFFENWNSNVLANCHQFSAPNRDNVKYVSEDGHYEVIYDVNGNEVTDPRDIGTYNYASPTDNPIQHMFVDVIPWIRWGNSPDDTTTPFQRTCAFFGIYI